jgi:iron complex transport system ATP-binding protein
MLELTNLSYCVKGRTLLKDIHFHLNTGKITGVLGANGAGKSTLIQLLSGDIQPTQGTIKLDRRPLNQWKPHALAQKRAIMLQQQQSPFSFKVLDYLLLARSMRDETQADAVGITTDIINQLDLMAFCHIPINRLSGGELQRIIFAKAWIQIAQPHDVKGKLLLLDEPTSALDICQQRAFFQNVSRFCKLGGTVLCVLHDINTAARFASEILLIKNGQQLAFGNVSDIFTTHHIQSCFDVQGHVFTDQINKIPQFMISDIL